MTHVFTKAETNPCQDSKLFESPNGQALWHIVAAPFD